MSHGLLLWLENIDRRRNEVVPIDPIQDSDTLHEHHKTLTVHNYNLLYTQQQYLLYNIRMISELIGTFLTSSNPRSSDIVLGAN